MAILTTERSLDDGMANQAIGHLRQIGLGNLFGFGHPTMAGAAGVSGIQVPAKVAGRLQVTATVDGCGDNRRDITHLQVKGVVEFHHPGGGWTRDLGIRVAFLTNVFRGEKVVLHLRAGEGGAMATGTFQLQLQMELMRKGRSCESRAPGEHQ
jgi:hypothetical protein